MGELKQEPRQKQEQHAVAQEQQRQGQIRRIPVSRGFGCRWVVVPTVDPWGDDDQISQHQHPFAGAYLLSCANWAIHRQRDVSFSTSGLMKMTYMNISRRREANFLRRTVPKPWRTTSTPNDQTGLPSWGSCTNSATAISLRGTNRATAQA